MFLISFPLVLSLLGSRKGKQKLNKTKECNRLLHQQTFSIRHNVASVVVFIVFHQLYVVNASINPLSSLFEIPSTEKAIVTPETQTYNATSNLRLRNKTESFENNVQDDVTENRSNNCSERFKRSYPSNNLTSTAETQKQKRLEEECINDIKSLYFERAEIKLNEIDDENIYFIVQKVYDHSTENFDLVLRFGNTIKNVRKSFLVYKALGKELDNHGHNSIKRYIELIKGSRRQIYFFLNRLQKEEAESFEATERKAIKDILKDTLKSYFKNCTNNPELKNLAETVYLMEDKLFGETIKEVMDYVFGFSVDINNLLICMDFCDNVKMKLQGYEAIIEQVENKSGFYEKVVFRLANRIRTHLENKNHFASISELKDYSVWMTTKLPHAVTLIMFSTNVGIKNTYYNEYLYAASDGFRYDSYRRCVFTWVPGVPVTQGEWLFEYYQPNDCFHIKNKAHNEYLYAAGFSLKTNQHRRRVFTWIPNDSLEDEKYCWKIEFVYDAENSIRIKNVYYNEYLLADKKYDEDRRHAFTITSGRRTIDSEWQLS